jgi:hypothetical protein
MYLFETRLGEHFKPRQKARTPTPKAAAKPPPKSGEVVKGRDSRFCLAPAGDSVNCDLNLNVKFRSSFEKFRLEVEDAYARWTTKKIAQMLVNNFQGNLKKLHDEMVDSKLRDNSSIVLVASLKYRMSNGAWIVVDSSLRQWRSA